ncbi:hypothetical protein [Cohnella fermenti]|uniref:Uncharacterized protein n=1 Tax=Cohnella fermenti TaxID=2565925 RepID=A0A4V3WFA2_9BACL|nr:hypothetical protein [Cohnella fermenti]THF79550.1 hypothetical protein E6C55_12285 [Cohnella fermenti]
MTTTQDNGQENQERQEAEKAMEQMKELVKALHHNGIVALQSQFEGCKVDGQVTQHNVYGPMFTFRVTKEDGNAYVCGFFLRELLSNFQTRPNPALWMSSFFVDLMKSPESVLLPRPPQNEDEAKKVMDGHILPHCFGTIKEEFGPDEIYSGLDLHPEHGPVLEAGFPKYKDGNNVVAMPLHLLLAHFLLNRDPADLILDGLYRILEEQEKAAGETADASEQPQA